MNLIDKIQKQVDDFKSKQFVAPYLGRNKIRVRINGLVLTLNVGQPRASDIAFPPALLVWETSDAKTAMAARNATNHELTSYLDLFPKVNMLVTRTDGKRKHYGIISRTGTGNISFDGELPFISLYDFHSFDLFDEIKVAFDGQTLFYRDMSIIQSDMVVAAWMRDELHHREFRFDNQAEIAARNARPEHKQAFQIAWDHMMADAAGMVETILGNAISHAGAKMQGYKEDEDTYAVTIEIDGVKQNPVVVSKDMEVLSAGICLHNEKVFDMQSLVSVLRERDRGYDDYDEEDDW